MWRTSLNIRPTSNLRHAISLRATELTVQSERAFQKQPHIFQNSKTKTKSTRPGKGGRRWYKDVGLGFRTPKTAIEGSYIDKKCPFTGLVSIRGRILTGTVVSTKMHRTIIIRREYLHFIPKYSRYEKRHKNVAAHVSPAFRVQEGDQVTVGQCRPLSKTVRFNVLRVLPRTGKSVKKFSKF
ncbi:40s ribosomal protein s11 [Fusarium flagelliforme]|uniref:40s ribosomal protein s11 n=1 Tax=Fusarium flagelliforme TaxID=2675880 RepID=A0A395MZ92_9HYPO|nr:40s ribosomal protein s11 [Fusarium flagelliforme]